MNKQQSHNSALADPALLIQPPVSSPRPSLNTHPDTQVMAKPLSILSSISHSVDEEGLAATSLLDERTSDGTSALYEVPLLPPAVFLEYLRSKRSQAPPTHFAPISQQVSKEPGAVLQEDVETSDPYWGSEMETTQQVRDRIRKQRDALHALLRAQHVKVTKTGSKTRKIMIYMTYFVLKVNMCLK